MVESPVLFITFARPEYARRTWDAIKAAKPKTLYFYSNKGRKEKEGEIEKNDEIRSYVKEIDWDCSLHTWFREECVNVYESLHGAIGWLFAKEEKGIILEEDCVASLAFFDFCDKLLVKYKNDYRIWMISGDNFFEQNDFGPYDYFFSQDMQIYGWASWRTRWQQVDWKNGLDYIHMEQESAIEANYRKKLRINVMKRLLRHKKEFITKTKCWDYTFVNIGALNNSLSVVPARNLVENIGLVGEHKTKPKKGVWNAEVTYTDYYYSIENSPCFICPNLKYDDLLLRKALFKAYAFPFYFIERFKRFVRGLL